MSSIERRSLIEGFCRGYVLPPFSQFAPTLFRARINDNGALFNHIDQLWAPPAALVKAAGRLNRAGERTLYLSSQPFAAIFETKPRISDLISVLACRTRAGTEPFQLAPVAMLQLRPDRRFGPLNPINGEGPLGLPPFAEILRQRGLTEQWSLQDETLGLLLVTDGRNGYEQALYDLTNGVREYLYRIWPEYDGLRYPSIVTGQTALNIALDQKRWKDIEPLEIWVAEVSVPMTANATGLKKYFIDSIHKRGVVRPNGTITYENSSKTLLTVLNDFKQAYGIIPPVRDLQPTLIQSFIRQRISFGSSLNRMVLDF